MSWPSPADRAPRRTSDPAPSTRAPRRFAVATVAAALALSCLTACVSVGGENGRGPFFNSDLESIDHSSSGIGDDTLLVTETVVVDEDELGGEAHSQDTQAVGESVTQGWTTYGNARFGFSVTLPSWLHGQEADDSDGATFRGRDSTVRVYGSNTPRPIESGLTDRHEVTYDDIGGRARTLSGIYRPEDGSEPEVFYWLYYNGHGSMNAIELEYPESRKAEFDEVVARVAETFTPGDITRSH